MVSQHKHQILPRSDTVQQAILSEVKPHLKALRDARSALQRAIDDSKVWGWMWPHHHHHHHHHHHQHQHQHHDHITSHHKRLVVVVIQALWKNDLGSIFLDLILQIFTN